jgi:DNA primase
VLRLSATEVLFPIRSDSGDVIAFGGRRVDDGPKYLNTAE